MSLIGIDDELRPHAETLQRAICFERLADRNALILFAVEDQRWSFDVGQVIERRLFFEHLARLPRGSAVQTFALLDSIGGSPIRYDVRYPGAVSRALESIGVADYPRRHITAIAPAGDSQPALVRNSDFDQVVNAAHDVIVIDFPHELRVRLGEFRAVVGRAPEVW